METQLKTQKNTSKIFTLFVFFLTLISAILPAAYTVFESDIVYAEDADNNEISYSGSVYWNTYMNPGGVVVDSQLIGAAVEASWFRREYNQSPEQQSENSTYAIQSWNYSSDVLNNASGSHIQEDDGGNSLSATHPFLEFAESRGKDFGAWFDNENGGDEWKAFRRSERMNSNSRQGYTLTMTFPGWGVHSKATNLVDGTEIDRDEYESLRIIDNNAQTNRAGQVNQNLLPEFNAALSNFYSQVVAEDVDASGSPTMVSSPELSTAGMANLIMMVGLGYQPKDTTQRIVYNLEDGTFASDTLGKLQKMDVMLGDGVPYDNSSGSIGNFWSATEVGSDVLVVQTTRESGTSARASQTPKLTYTYGVVKDPTAADQDSRFYATDLYILSWMDIVTSSLNTQYIGGSSVEQTADTNTTVLGDQVQSWLYSVVSSITGFFGVRPADEVVFGDSGNMFQNDAFEILRAIQLPSMIIAFIILFYVLISAFFKSAGMYAQTDQVRAITSAPGKIFMMVILLAFMPVIVLGAGYLDQILVDFALGLNQTMAQLINVNATLRAQGWFSSAISSVILVFIVVFIDVKFTWRYIARAITFGIYYVTLPILFALNIVRNPIGPLQFEPESIQAVKEIIGLMLMRSIDAIGIVFALNFGKLLFGETIFITIVGYLIIEQITNALMTRFGIKGASISGIAESGENMVRSTMKTAKNAGTRAAVAGAGLAAARGLSRYDFEKERADELGEATKGSIQNYQRAQQEELYQNKMNELSKDGFKGSDEDLKVAALRSAQSEIQSSGQTSYLGDIASDKMLASGADEVAIERVLDNAGLQTGVYDENLKDATKEEYQKTHGSLTGYEEKYFNALNTVGDSDATNEAKENAKKFLETYDSQYMIDQDGNVSLSSGTFETDVDGNGNPLTRFVEGNTNKDPRGKHFIGSAVGAGIGFGDREIYDETRPGNNKLKESGRRVLRAGGDGLRMGLAGATGITNTPMDDILVGAALSSRAVNKLTGNEQDWRVNTVGPLLSRITRMPPQSFKTPSSHWKGGKQRMAMSYHQDPHGFTTMSPSRQSAVNSGQTHSGRTRNLNSRTTFRRSADDKQLVQQTVARSSSPGRAGEIVQSMERLNESSIQFRENVKQNNGNFTAGDISELAYNPETGATNRDAADLLDYMNTKGYSSGSFSMSDKGGMAQFNEEFNLEREIESEKALNNDLETSGYHAAHSPDNKMGIAKDDVNEKVYRAGENGSMKSYGKDNQVYTKHAMDGSTVEADISNVGRENIIEQAKQQREEISRNREQYTETEYKEKMEPLHSSNISTVASTVSKNNADKARAKREKERKKNEHKVNNSDNSKKPTNDKTSNTRSNHTSPSKGGSSSGQTSSNLNLEDRKNEQGGGNPHINTNEDQLKNNF